MAALYELTSEYIELLEMAQDETLDQKMISDTLEGVDFEFEKKAESSAIVIRNLEGDLAAIDKEIERLTAKKRTLKNNISSIKKNVENSMISIGKRKFKTLLFSFGIQKNPASVVIDDESCVPKKFWKQKDPEIDKKALSAYLKENEVGWAHLSQTESLRIR